MGVSKAAWGKVEALQEDRVVVRWSASSGEKNLLPCFDLNCLVAAEPPAAEAVQAAPTPAERAIQRGQILLALPKGVLWTSRVDRATREACAGFLSSLLYQLHSAQNISGTELRWWEVAPKKGEAAGAAPPEAHAGVEAAGAASVEAHAGVEAAGAASAPFWACAALADLKAGRLALVPWPVAVLLDAPDKVSAGQVVIPVHLDLGANGKDILYLVGPPTRTVGEVTATPDGDARLLFPFWDLIGAEQGSGQALSMKQEFVDMHLHGYTTGKAFPARRPGKKEFWRVSVPFWTNASAISVGDRLWVPPNALEPQQVKEGAKPTDASSA